jgi:alkylhydroperoxidase family enzyme
MGHVDFMAAVAGLPPSHVFDLETRPPADPVRAVVFPFARQLTRAPETIERADVQRLQQHLTDDQIVQLVFAVCHFNTMNRLADAFGVPLESTNVFAPHRPTGARPSAMPPVPPAKE